MFSRLVFTGARSGVRYLSSPSAAFLPTAQVTDRVLNVVQSIKYAPEVVSVDADFAKDLEFDSIIVSDLVSKLGAEFCVNVTEKDASGMKSVKAAIDFFSSHPKAR
jgi:acyl carrier protein